MLSQIPCRHHWIPSGIHALKAGTFRVHLKTIKLFLIYNDKMFHLRNGPAWSAV